MCRSLIHGVELAIASITNNNNNNRISNFQKKQQQKASKKKRKGKSDPIPLLIEVLSPFHQSLTTLFTHRLLYVLLLESFLSTGLWLSPYQRGAEERARASVQSGANTQTGERVSRVPSGEAESEVQEQTS